ncbi:MAG: hypothetical protein IJZ03_01930 [Clostridia bacterium]|nr:hypothetical protein [Clostridia bacterium]
MSTKKKIVVVAVALCLVAILSMGTLAWFTASDSVTNEFYVGDSNTDPDDVFGIDVWETVDGVDYGKDTADDEGAIYEDILPGQRFSKAPYLTNTGIHPQFVRAIVTVTEARILREAMEGAWGDADKFLPGTADTWTLTDILYTVDDELVYIYYYNTELAAGATTEELFKEVVIPTGLTLEQAQEMRDFEVSILGQVIQSEHLGDPATPGAMVTTAQRAFELYWDAEGTVAGYADEDIKANGKVNENATADVYYTIGENGTAEGSFTGVTATVNEAFVVVPTEFNNATIIIDSCNLTVPDGAYVVKAEGAGGLCVYISTDTTLNGTPIFDVANYEDYFQNVLVFPFSN